MWNKLKNIEYLLTRFKPGNILQQIVLRFILYSACRPIFSLLIIIILSVLQLVECKFSKLMTYRHPDIKNNAIYSENICHDIMYTLSLKSLKVSHIKGACFDFLIVFCKDEQYIKVRLFQILVPSFHLL